jgi:uncharacterized protein
MRSSIRTLTEGQVVESLVINVVEVARRPGNRKPVQISAPVGGIALGDVSVSATSKVDLDLVLEAMSDGLTVTGTVAGTWSTECRRCLAPASGRLVVDVRELCQVTVTAEDAYEYDGEQLDLEPIAREALLLDLPIAPLCQDDCAGLCPDCGANRNEGDCGHQSGPTDARWSGLDALKGLLPDT